MRDNPSSWDGYELALEGEEMLRLAYRNNPDPAFVEELPADIAAEIEGKPKKGSRGALVKKLDEGMALDIAAAGAGERDAMHRVQEHYYNFVLHTLGGLFVRGMLWQSQKTLGKWNEDDFRMITDDTFSVLFTGTRVSDATRQRKREHHPVILKWKPELSTFTTFLLGVAKRVAREYFGTKVKRHKGEKQVKIADLDTLDEFTRGALEASRRGRRRGGDDGGGSGDDFGDVEEGEFFDTEEGVEDEVRKIDPETKALGEQQAKVLLAALPKLAENHRRIIEARLGRDRDADEKATLKGEGKPYTRSYAEMREYLGLSSIRTVMSGLFRARKQLEKVSGLPLRGLVGLAKEQFGKDNRGHKSNKEPPLEEVMQPTKEQLQELEAALLPAKKTTVIRRRQNPAEVWIYFETEDDLVDLLHAGYIDDDSFEQCRRALHAMGW